MRRSTTSSSSTARPTSSSSTRSEEHTSELQSPVHLVCRLLLEKKKDNKEAFVALLGDDIIGYGTWAWSARAAVPGKSPVYRYYFTRCPPGALPLSIRPRPRPSR